MIVDYQTIFCDKQVITETTLSNRAIDLQALADYGKGRQWFVHCLVQGAHEKDLRVQIVGSNTVNFADVKVLGDSGVVAQAELVQGKDFYVAINPIAKKYRYVALRFIPSTDGTEVPSSESTSGVGTLPPVLAVNEDVTAVANAIRGQIEFVVADDVTYPHANDGMSYSATQLNG